MSGMEGLHREGLELSHPIAAGLLRSVCGSPPPSAGPAAMRPACMASVLVENKSSLTSVQEASASIRFCILPNSLTMVSVSPDRKQNAFKAAEMTQGLKQGCFLLSFTLLGDGEWTFQGRSSETMTHCRQFKARVTAGKLRFKTQAGETTKLLDWWL